MPDTPVQPLRTRKKRPFLRFLKIMFLLLLILVVLAAGAFTVAYFTIDPQVLVTRVSEMLREKYNREIEIKTVQISLLKGISLDGISLSQRGGFSKGTALELEQGAVFYNPVSLLAGELDILRIRLAGFYTTYDKIMDIVRDFTSAEGAEPLSETPPAKKGPGVFRLTLRSVEIADAQVVYNNIPLNLEAVLSPKPSLSDTQVRMLVRSMYGTFTIDGTLNRAQIKVDQLDAGKFAPGSGDIQVSQVQFTLVREDENRFSVLGKSLEMTALGYRISTFTRFEGTYSLRSQTVLLRDLGVQVNDAQVYLDRLSYYVRSKQLSLNITNISARLSDLVPGFAGRVSGSLDVEKGRSLILSGRLRVEGFQYRFIKDGVLDLRLDNNNLQGQLELTTSGGRLNLSARSEDVINKPTVLSLESDKYDLYPLLQDFQSGRSSASTNSAGTAQGTLSLPPLILQAYIRDLAYQQYSLEEVRLTASYQRGGLDLEKCSLDFIGGHLEGSGRLVGSSLSGQLSYSGGNLRKFSELYLKDGKKLFGKINASSRFRINLQRPLDTVMDFELNLTGGEIIDFLLLEKINGLLFFIPGDNIQYDTIQASLNMREGVVNIQSLDFRSPDITITTTGQVLPGTQTQDIRMLIAVNQRYLEGGAFIAKPFIPGRKKGDIIENTVHIQGSFKNPAVKLNP